MSRTVQFAAAITMISLAGAGVYYATRVGHPPRVITQTITRGMVEETVGATGTLEAVTTIQVGTQVSGTIQELHADFNTQVRAGQVIARLDPSLIKTQIDEARANLERSGADLDRLRLAEADALRKLERARKLAGDGLISAMDLDSAEAAYMTASAQVRSAAAAVTQARAAFNQAQVNLEKTVITSPINGIVIARNVDVGQTVAASFQAPTLFVIAADLTKMRVNASVSEADIGRIRPGLVTRFRVDAYPGRQFPGVVSLVRLNPVIQQNVVTYATVIDVPNRELKLKPGMTATVTIQVAKRDDVLRAPNAALRFHPTREMLAALGQKNSDETTGGETKGPQTGRPLHSENSGQLWFSANGSLVSKQVLLGITDGTNTELCNANVEEGAEAVTGILLENTPTAAGSTNNPLLGTPRTPGIPRGPR